MLRFVADTGFLVGRKCPGDQFHDVSVDIWDKLIELKLVEGIDNLYVTNYVLVESHLQIQQKAGCDCASKFWTEMLKRSNVKWVNLDFINKSMIEKLFKVRNHKTGEPHVGLVDAITLQMMDTTKIRLLLSFDDGFDRYPLVRRIDSVDAVMALFS